MADINWSLTGSASGSGTGTVGTDTYIKDNNTGTYFGAQAGGGPGGSWDYIDTITFTETALKINKVELYHYEYAWQTGPGLAEGEWWVDIYYSGAWHNIMTNSYSSQTDNNNKTSSSTTGWVNVSSVRVRGDGSYASSGAVNGSWHRTYELRAWGPLNYSDIGFRVRAGASTLKIGTQALDGHALRIRKGATTYGIPLIATNDGSACGIRIYDGASVKSVPEVA